MSLGLAQYAGKGEVVLSLYNEAVDGTGDSAYDSAIRLAAISNLHAEGVFTSMFGIHVTPKVQALLARGDEYEMAALVVNPQHRTLLKLLYLGEAPFDTLDDTQRMRLVTWSARNPGLNINRDSVDGPDMQAWDIQKAVWTLMRTAPLKEEWATALHSILVNLDPHHSRTASSQKSGCLATSSLPASPGEPQIQRIEASQLAGGPLRVVHDRWDAETQLPVSMALRSLMLERQRCAAELPLGTVRRPTRGRPQAAGR